MAEPIKDPKLTDPKDRMKRLRELLGADFSNYKTANKFEFRKAGSKGRWYMYRGDPISDE